MSITRKMIDTLLPGKILAVQVGLSRTAVLAETDSGVVCGLAATLSNPELDHRRRPSVLNAGHLHEMDFRELAELVDSDSHTEVSVGLAAINALLPRSPDTWMDLNAEKYLLENSAGKNVAMIGHFPVADELRARAGNLWVLELNPREGDLPANMAAEMLPRADIIALTGTTLINKTFDGLISLRRPDAAVIMLGPSTPLSPVLFDAGVDILSGTVVVDPHAALLGVGQGIALHQLCREGWVRLVTVKKEGK